MAERVFLEDVGKPYSVNAIGDARAWEVHHLRKDPAIPPLIYVMESEMGQSFSSREGGQRPTKIQYDPLYCRVFRRTLL